MSGQILDRTDCKKLFLQSGQRYHVIRKYTANVFKITQWYSPYGPALHAGPKQKTDRKAEGRLMQSVSRSKRMLLEYAICNEWDYFVTLTLDPQKVADRSDLKAYHDKLAFLVRFCWCLSATRTDPGICMDSLS